MNTGHGQRAASRSHACIAAAAALLLLAGCERPPVDTVQRGYRGLAMGEVYNPRLLAAKAASNALPASAGPVQTAGPPASSVYKNVQVLGDVPVAEFVRLMTSMTAWVSPDQGCNYCHVTADLSSDELYTKLVARRMLQMTRHINSDWKTHVAATGVTCYTCHRGQPVPANVWYRNPGERSAGGVFETKLGKNEPAPSAGLTSLPYDPFTPFLDQNPADIRVVSTGALPAGNRRSIKETDWTYALMIHMSESLGVNCTYCHNSRSFYDWSASPPPRATAWYGIRMTRDLNTGYLDGLAGVLPPARHGPLGDGPKVDCATCHQGAFKPLYGASLAAEFPELSGAK